MHGVLGTAFTDFGTGHWQHWYRVLQSGAVATGVIREHYVDNSYGIDTRFVIVVDCLEVEESTREAWMGGVVVRVDGNFPPLGTNVVYYVDDNHGTGQPDIHGGIYTGADWGEPDYKCTDRPAPWFPDLSQRGRVRVF